MIKMNLTIKGVNMKLFRIITLASLGLAALLSNFNNQAFAYEDGILLSTTMSTSSPFLTTLSPLRIMDCSNWPHKRHSPNTPANKLTDLAFSCEATLVSVATSTSALLLKEIQEAQPDALDYLAGASPSPMLYAVVEKIQDAVFEETGKKVGFDNVVNEIIGSI